METHFNQPQRQSSIGILVLFFDTLQHYARVFLPFLVIWVVKYNEINKIYLVLGFISIVLIVALIAYLKYLNFTFYLDYDKEEFVINEGTFLFGDFIIKKFYNDSS